MDPTTELAEPTAGTQPSGPAADDLTTIRLTVEQEEDEDASWEVVRADSPAIAALAGPSGG